jgi:uncharacterized protein YdhG (YjbR/CyaY superfamily)
MKKANSGSATKRNVARKNTDEYLAAVPEPARSTLTRIRAMIRSAVPPEATEVISYRIPTFRYKGPLVGFAAFPNHCSFFPMSSSVLERFENDLQGLETSKGTIRFPVDQPLSAALVKKVVKSGIAQNELKKQR